ncbi:hypothetical protein D9757_001994 [Collybiopsis confluens]|uniref:Argininosuccinate lyase n=1 Tax=Collybiopsis confluens TaxID=2823264 RepID=A0A8H5HXG3_9AGAR|nr:hypothetical protein D9757_001994 [Collybiopsis confluens]
MPNDNEPTKQKLWGGRFTGKTDPLYVFISPGIDSHQPISTSRMHTFNQSLAYDQRMHAADIKGSIAYAKGLRRVGILTEDEQDKIITGLETVETEWKNGTFKPAPDDEDIHTANERRLTEIIGSLGGKLHTGRSRNDQVATDMRLWLLEEIGQVENGLKGLIRVMVERADKEKMYLMPGYTHLQRGQPIRWSHLLLSHAFSFKNDLERLQQLIPRISVLPLGSGALAGNPFVVDRDYLAKELGFQSVAENSLWGVSDRDFIVEFLMWATLAMTHISRMAEDLIIYSTAEFGFITLSDAYSTGSSMMPQKKNPDSLELLRGKSGRIFGNMAGFVMTLKGLPSTYNKDLQEDKEPLFDALVNVSMSFQIAEGVIATLDVHPEKMRQALTMDVLATDLADYLVRKGMPFRETHHISGRAVALAESRKCQLNELSSLDFKSLSDKFTEDVHDVFDFEASVERRQAIGGPSRKMIFLFNFFLPFKAMARDRLAALRAQQQGGASQMSSNSYPTQASGGGGGGYQPRRANPYAQQDSAYEMTDVKDTPATYSGDSDDMSAFYAEISSLQDSIRTFNENVSRIGELHSRSLNNTDDVAAQRNAAQLDELVADTSALSATLKRRIKALERQGGSGRDSQIRKQQTALVKSKFVEAIQTYQNVEQQYRTRYKQRMERQFKIVKPDASPEEVKAVVNDESGGQIFSQALLNSNRYGESRAAYREVQERHEDIKRIEKTLGELAQLFNDMSVLVEQQDETIQNIETTAANVEKDTEAGCNNLEDCRQQAFEKNKTKLESERTVTPKMATA